MVGSFGDFVFSVSSAETSQGVTFNALTASTASRLLTHTTIDGLPVVEFAGVDAERVQLTGVLNEQICADIDDKILEMKALQDGVPRALTRGDRVFGMFVVESLSFTEERWSANGTPLAVSYSLNLISTRVLSNG